MTLAEALRDESLTLNEVLALLGYTKRLDSFGRYNILDASGAIVLASSPAWKTWEWLVEKAKAEQ